MSSGDDIACRWWSPSPNRRAGWCGLGLLGGHPSKAACRVCLANGNADARCAVRSNVPITVRGSGPVAGGPIRPTVEAVRWLGIRWIGKPFPLRLRWASGWPPVVVEDAPGCGCIMRLKLLWTRLRRRKKKGCGCRNSR